MRHQSRLLITPFVRWAVGLPQHLPFNLGHGFFVDDVKSIISSIDLTLPLGKRLDTVGDWRICLVRRYRLKPGLSQQDQESAHLMRYVVALLRLISPNGVNANNSLRIEDRKRGSHLVSGFSVDSKKIYLHDCEKGLALIGLSDLTVLARWMPTVYWLWKHRAKAPALDLSLGFSEKSYQEFDWNVRHLLLVMALEALFSDDKIYCSQALKTRTSKFLGEDRDLYAPYRGATPSLPVLRLGSILTDVCQLRNKIAHGTSIPARFGVRIREGIYQPTIAYADELLGAAVSMLRLSWKRIIEDDLRDVFADKAKMKAYFKATATV